VSFVTVLELDPRQAELIEAFVRAWEQSGHVPFEWNVSGSFVGHPSWPESVNPPMREEVRGLLHLNLLESDRSVAPLWRVFPSADARAHFGGPDQAQIAVALRDPDARLGVILEGVVEAFKADASEPLHFAAMDTIAIVQHPYWPLAPDVVASHDLAQLEDLGLIGTEARGEDTAFWPTSAGRAAVADPAGFLDRRAEQVGDERERTRLREWAKKVRAGDIAVGTLTGASSAVIRALIGL
jgi:hypothetical protein